MKANSILCKLKNTGVHKKLNNTCSENKITGTILSFISPVAFIKVTKETAIER